MYCALLIAAAILSTPPEEQTTERAGTVRVEQATHGSSWQRQSGETCSQYTVRLEANNFLVWREHWCGDGPCYTSVSVPGGPGKSAAGFSLSPYFANCLHGCGSPNFPACSGAP